MGTTSESTWNLVGLEVHPKVILNSTNILPPHSTHCSGQSSTLTPRCLYAEAQSTLVNWASLPILWSVSNTSFVSAMGHLKLSLLIPLFTEFGRSSFSSHSCR